MCKYCYLQVVGDLAGWQNKQEKQHQWQSPTDTEAILTQQSRTATKQTYSSTGVNSCNKYISLPIKCENMTGKANFEAISLVNRTVRLTHFIDIVSALIKL